MKELNLWKMGAAPSGAVPGSLLPGTLGAVWGLREVPERLRVKLLVQEIWWVLFSSIASASSGLFAPLAGLISERSRVWVFLPPDCK